MDLWNLFKRKKKIKTGICFSNEKSVEELLKIFLEKLNPESFKNINEEELVKYNSLLINFEALDKEEEKNEEKFMMETAKFLREFHKFTIQKKLNHYHFGDRRMIQNDEKWKISDFIPPLSEKMFLEYDLEMTDNDLEKKILKE